MNCNKCGATDLPGGAQFCTYCGASTAPSPNGSNETGLAQPSVAPNGAAPAGSPIQELLAKAQGSGLRVDDRLVWVLAFMPLIGEFIQRLVAELIYGNSFGAAIAVRSGKFWWVILLINVALCWQDERNLKAAGVDTSKFGKSLWLIPLYLYQRAAALKHTLAYFIVWCVCFVILIS